MATLSTAAWIAHDLGLAAGVGGTLFGRVALHPSLKEVEDPQQRGRLTAQAWQRFNTYQLAGLGLMAASWFAGRSLLTGREVDQATRGLVLAKDGLVLATMATAVGTAITGRLMAKQGPDEGLPMHEGGGVAAEAPETAQRLNRVTDVLGLLSLVAGMGVIATTAILAMRAGESGRWTWVSRRLK
jgi:uncharacterized membrane protein